MNMIPALEHCWCSWNRDPGAPFWVRHVKEQPTHRTLWWLHLGEGQPITYMAQTEQWWQRSGLISWHLSQNRIPGIRDKLTPNNEEVLFFSCVSCSCAHFLTILCLYHCSRGLGLQLVFAARSQSALRILMDTCRWGNNRESIKS